MRLPNWMNKPKFSKADVRNYGNCFEIIEEIKKCPKLKETIFQKREDCIKRLFNLEGDKKLQMEGRIIELNWILGMDSNCLSHINTFRAIAKERESDIDEALNEQRFNEEVQNI